MKKSKAHDIDDVVVSAENLNLQQPLGRFLIILFRHFESELMVGLSRENIDDVFPSDFNVLRHISPEGSTLKEIVLSAGISKQAVSQIADDLAERGFIKKKSDPKDKRSKQVIFTKKGSELIKKCIEVIGGIEKKYKAALAGEKNLVRVKTDLKKLIDLHVNNKKT